MLGVVRGEVFISIFLMNEMGYIVFFVVVKLVLVNLFVLSYLVIIWLFFYLIMRG